MTSVLTEEVEIGQCKCCLNENDLRDLWAVYICCETGESEIYGEMLIDCYFLSWSPPEDHLKEHICQTCIHRLREAYNFKNDILQTERLLSDATTSDNKNEIIKQNTSDDEMMEEVDYLEESPKEIESCDEEEDSGDEIYLDLKEEVKEPDFEEVEYLEDENVVDYNEATKANHSASSSDFKIVKRNPKHRNYKETEMKKALEVIKAREMTRIEAAGHYSIPYATLKTRAQEAKSQGDGANHIEKNMSSRDDLLNNRERRRNAMLLLLHTTVLPFKWFNNVFTCVYCLKVFSKIEDLRAHNAKLHKKPTHREVEKACKNIPLTQDVKVDVISSACRLCSDPINGFDTLKEHLNDKHQRNIGVNNDGVLPFKLIKTGDFDCALCDESYTEYNKLNNHMNKHYQKYFCKQCEAGFLSLSRLQKHEIVHSTERYPCELCNKTFKHPSIRYTHLTTVHTKKEKWRCRHCGLAFKNHNSKLQHLIEVHQLTDRLVCEYCAETCLSQTHLERHVKRVHLNVKKYACDICSRRFFFASKLRIHQRSHYRKIQEKYSNEKQPL